MLPLIALLFAQTANAQAVCGGNNYNVDPADFAGLPMADFQAVPIGTQSFGHTELSPYTSEGVNFWPDFWVTNSFCIPGMDTTGCGGTNNYVANYWQQYMSPSTPSDAFAFVWGTQGPSVDITVWTSDGLSQQFAIVGQTDFFGYCTGTPAVTITKVLIESADGGIDDIQWGSLNGPLVPALGALQMVAGALTNLAVYDAIPGEVVYFGGAGAIGAGPCPALLGGACVDLVSPILLGSAVADAAGAAVLQVTVPAGLSGQTVYIQAAIPRGPGGVDSVVTWVESTTVF